MENPESRLPSRELISDGEAVSPETTPDSVSLQPVEEDADIVKDSNTLINYEKANKYWTSQPASLNGMLGGQGQVSHIDIKASNDLLISIWKWKRPPGRSRAIDCGAGIGRITRQLLSRHFSTVDVVEQCAKFVDVARETLKDNPHVGEFYNEGLQQFVPNRDTYDVIWCQWVLGHLTDYDLVSFFQRCSEALRQDGVIVVKENVTSEDEPEFDPQDSSVTRPRAIFEDIFARAQLRLVATRRQAGMPSQLFPVVMFVLRPAENAIQR